MGTNLEDGGTFDFFELRIQHVVFSYTALEAYANESIPDPFTWKTKNSKGEEVTYDRDQTERLLSLDEKLEHVLTSVFGKASIKAGAMWNDFKILKKLRDRLIHVKHFDSRAKPDAAKDSVWADLYLTRDTDFSSKVHEVILYFNGNGRTWAKKFPYEELVSRGERAVLNRARNEKKRARKRDQTA